MIINRKEITNPYFLAYIDEKAIKDGENWVGAYKYINWINKKHKEFKSLNNISQWADYNEEQTKDFIKYLNEED